MGFVVQGAAVEDELLVSLDVRTDGAFGLDGPVQELGADGGEFFADALGVVVIDGTEQREGELGCGGVGGPEIGKAFEGAVAGDDAVVVVEYCG